MAPSSKQAKTATKAKTAKKKTKEKTGKAPSKAKASSTAKAAAKSKPKTKDKDKAAGGAKKTTPAAKAKTTLKAKVEAASKKADAPAMHRGAAAKAKSQTATGRPARRSGRKGGGHRRESRIYPPGDLLLPAGAQTHDEALYLFRGCVAAENPAAEEGMAEIIAKRGIPEGDAMRDELVRDLTMIFERFADGSLDPLLPARTFAKRTFLGVVERVKIRRREIGAFLRGLDIGRTEVSHLDSHGETSLQNLMEWTARIEKMVEEGEEPENADYNQIHRGLDQLDATTEGLVVDIETTLRRMRERAAK